ncbi:hypothetical protein Q7C_1485 [Methylophaga frappieri]|uniref:Uncharacterized protein n=1 Tax=Methylophaga frappieri (strain ATCC BAA-2434 / DSM 25690 / JAM7) TaxID=754477 RepID=I1YI91_METFJ|nr:hypothetical protein [Methylophaga frappieri]AFJ02634.1 hypothetical protein Q7C_1485 [Methylophaga frappieri]
MNSAAFSQIAKATLSMVLLTTSLFPVASAQSDIAAELRQKTMECRTARIGDCVRACFIPSRELDDGREVSEADIEACRNAHAQLATPAKPEPTWTPEYAPLPDVVGVFRGALVNAQGRDDWKRYCRSSAIVGDGTPWNVPKGATVRVSGIRYVTNPINSFDRSKNACRADSVEVVSTP